MNLVCLLNVSIKFASFCLTNTYFNCSKYWIGVVAVKSNTAARVAAKNVAMYGVIAASAVASAAILIVVVRIYVRASLAPVD